MPLRRPDEIEAVLEESKTIAVVGYSNDPNRPSYLVAHTLKSFGYDVYFVNPTLPSSPDSRIYARLADIPVPIDIVDIFRRPEFVPAVVEDAIAVGAKVVWMQIRIFNEEAAKRAEEAGLKVVMGRCLKLEYLKHFGAAAYR